MERGFTLVEIAIVVLVLGLLLASLLGPLSVRIEQQEIRKTSDQIQEIKEAFYGYAMANGALPCPDTDTDGNGDGLSDQDTSDPTQCDKAEGWLPFQTLGVAAADAWGFRFRYRVTQAFTVADDGHTDHPELNHVCSPSDGDLDLCDTNALEDDGPNITVGTRPYTSPHTVASAVSSRLAISPAIILSHGKNGFGATRMTGDPMPPPAPNSDEGINAEPSGTLFVSRHYTVDQSPCDDTDPTAAYCEFDDIVVWLSANVLKYRLVQAGRLP